MGPEIAFAEVVAAGLSALANTMRVLQGFTSDNRPQGSHFSGCFRCPSCVPRDCVEKPIRNCVRIDKDSSFLLARPHLIPKPPPVEQALRRTRFKKFRAGLPRILHRPSTSRRESETQSDLGGTLKLMESHKKHPPHIGLPWTQVPNGKHPSRNTFIGLSTDKRPMYTLDNATAHWKTFRPGSFSACEKTAPPTIAVVNWTAKVITMFIKVDWENETYYRTYQILLPNLDLFKTEFAQFAIFSGVIELGLLKGIDSEIVEAKYDRKRQLKSENSWSLLGFRDQNVTLPSESLFLAMKRAAVFGIIESLYEDPTLLDVTMLAGGKRCKEEFVRVKNPRNETLSLKPDNFFTVFAFNASAHANERVLVG